jgi:hypothetical protein
MPYGVEVFNNNDQFQFGTTAQEGLSVIDIGTINSAATLTGLNTENEILCLRRSTTGPVRGNLTEGTSGSFLNNSGVTVDYIRLRKMTQTTTNDTGNYGIEVYNSSGVITYTSKYTRGLRLLSVANIGTASGTTIYTGSLTGIYYGFGAMSYVTGSSGNTMGVANFNYTSNTISVIFERYYPDPLGNPITITHSSQSSLLILARN